MVSESSGCLDLSDTTSKFSLSKTHFDMNKFGKPTEEDFETVRDVVQGMTEAAHTSGQVVIPQVESILDDLAQKRGMQLNWRDSVVDLLMVLGLPSNLTGREQLAKELHVQVGPPGSAIQNTALRKEVMKKLVISNENNSPKILGLNTFRESGRRVPNPLDKCYACGKVGHWAADCPDKCYACGKLGHWASDCPNKCYVCGELGHWADECPNECYNCKISHKHETLMLLHLIIDCSFQAVMLVTGQLNVPNQDGSSNIRKSPSESCVTRCNRKASSW